MVSVKILREWNFSQISISTNVVSTKWYHLGINATDNVSFRAILGLGSKDRFSLKRQNVIFICIMKCKQTVNHQNKVEKIRIQTDCCNFFPLYNYMIEYSYFQNTILLASLYWFKFIVEVRVFYFSTKTYRRRKLKLLQKAILQPSSKRHSFAEAFLVSLIINLIRGERQDFEINKPAKGWKTVSRQNRHLINHVFLKRLSSILELYYWEETEKTVLKGDSEATINSLSS